MDQVKFDSQIAYLKKLRDATRMKLDRHHDEVFKGTKWFIRIPHYLHRSVLEKRLFYYYSAKNYHYPKNSPEYKLFAARAKKVLSQQYADDYATAEAARKQELKDRHRFNEEGVKKMEIEAVDGYLTALGIYVDAPEEDRRKVLWEYFHVTPRELPMVYDKHGKKKVRIRRRFNGPNKYILGDLILANPNMGWWDFKRRFKAIMPTITQGYFNVVRSRLRTQGYYLPNRRGKGVHRRGRTVMEIEIEKTTDSS